MTERDRPADTIRYSKRPRMDRRSVLRLALSAGVAGVAFSAGVAALGATGAAFAFIHGVASGDPLSDKVIIWTRVTPIVAGAISVQWFVATDKALANIVAHGTVSTSAAVDYTVKVDVAGLSPNTGYYYGFRVGAIRSAVGATRTLPVGAVSEFHLAVFSCADFDKGYFNAYNAATKLGSLNVILHIGDYIYEYGPGDYHTTAMAYGLVQELRNNQLQPSAETYQLAQYRLRYATHRTDPDLQKLHAGFPWIVIWDDHESANDSWTGGAQNHNPATQGSWAVRKAASVQAYYEWMPLREPADGNRIDPVSGNPAHMYRAFDIGDLAKLIMLDTRLAGRNQQKTGQDFLNLYFTESGGAFPLDVQSTGGPPRTMMGVGQESWFTGQIADSVASGQVWQLIGSQILMHYQIAPDFLNTALLTKSQKTQFSNFVDGLYGAGSGANFGYLGSIGAPNPSTQDSWTGYPSAKSRMIGALATATNPVVLSGDSHNFWAAELRAPLAGGKFLQVGVEFGGSSATSPGYEQTFPTVPGVLDLDPAVFGPLIVESNQKRSPTDRLVYADTTHRGFMYLTVTPTQVRTDYILLDTVFSTTYATSRARFSVRAGAKKIVTL